ncbi:MAG: hypothetical protein U9O82_11095 [Thermodesulfobacteriota bacterium]|nr:hypothetical protein [Thermodesulfobacteriota bacterium]
MKRSVFKKSLALAAAAVVFSATSAMATFEDFSLVRVVYDTAGSIEIHTDLGDVNTLSVGGPHTVGGGVDAWTPADFGYESTDPGDNNYANLKVAYFATGGFFNGGDAWVSSTRTPEAIVGTTAGILTASMDIRDRNSQFGPNTVERDSTNIYASSTYWQAMDKWGVGVGTYAGTLTTGSFSEALLADLDTVGYVDQTLYYLDINNQGPDANVLGVELADIRTMADGSTIITQSAVPIPGTVLLFGSGLLGLVGLKRSKNDE